MRHGLFLLPSFLPYILILFFLIGCEQPSVPVSPVFSDEHVEAFYRLDQMRSETRLRCLDAHSFRFFRLLKKWRSRPLNPWEQKEFISGLVKIQNAGFSLPSVLRQYLGQHPASYRKAVRKSPKASQVPGSRPRKRTKHYNHALRGRVKKYSSGFRS